MLRMSDFGRWFSEAKVKVVSDQLERLKVSRASVPTRDGRKADLTIKHLQRKNDELNEAIADLKEERDRVREEAERRHEEVDSSTARARRAGKSSRGIEDAA